MSQENSQSMIELTIENGLAEIVLNAPQKMNALNEQALADLSAAYDVAEEAGVRSLILRGEGRGFCAGRDIVGLTPNTDDAYEYLSQKVTPLLQKMSAFSAPTFAAVQGACLGVGLGLAIATDVVYVAENARIGSPFANLGATLDSGGHYLFVERLGVHRTLDLIYTGDFMSGAEAVQAGLFSRSLSADNLLEFTRDKAQKAATGATQAFLASKKIVQNIRDERVALWASVEEENIAQGKLCISADYAEGFAAFQEKRKPEFKGI